MTALGLARILISYAQSFGDKPVLVQEIGDDTWREIDRIESGGIIETGKKSARGNKYFYFKIGLC